MPEMASVVEIVSRIKLRETTKMIKDIFSFESAYSKHPYPPGKLRQAIYDYNFIFQILTSF